MLKVARGVCVGEIGVLADKRWKGPEEEQCRAVVESYNVWMLKRKRWLEV